MIKARFYVNLISSTSGAAEESELIMDSLKDILSQYEDTLNPYVFNYILAEFERNILMLGEVWSSILIVAG